MKLFTGLQQYLSKNFLDQIVIMLIEVVLVLSLYYEARSFMPNIRCFVSWSPLWELFRLHWKREHYIEGLQEVQKAFNFTTLTI